MRPAEAYKMKKAQGEVLTAALEHEKILRLTIRGDALDARSWTAVPVGGGKAVPLAGFGPSDGDESVYVSVRQEKDGQHEFVALAEVLAGAAPLALLAEADVKSRFCPRLFYARPDAPAAAAPMTRWEHADLTPHGSWTNYSVVPWLSLGRTRALLLSDEETLCRDVPTEPIFHHLELVVNCHQDRPGRPYKAGSPWASGSPPKVVANAVHKWYSSRGANINAKIDAINEATWDALQRGTVAVHCLAGIHRAACIAACMFLYRHYVLGHAHVPADAADIYRKLQSVRPHVSPAYEDILRGYEAYLKQKARR